MKLSVAGNTICFSNKEEELIMTFANEKGLSIHDLLVLSLISLDEEHFIKYYQVLHCQNERK